MPTTLNTEPAESTVPTEITTEPYEGTASAPEDSSVPEETEPTESNETSFLIITTDDPSTAIPILAPVATDATSLKKEIIIRATLPIAAKNVGAKASGKAAANQIPVPTGSASYAGIVLILMIAVTVCIYFFYRKKR